MKAVILMSLLISWVCGVVWLTGFLFIMWRPPIFQDINFPYVFAGEAVVTLLGCIIASELADKKSAKKRT